MYMNDGRATEVVLDMIDTQQPTEFRQNPRVQLTALAHAMGHFHVNRLNAES